MSLKDWFRPEKERHEALGSCYVAVDPSRCVQCGICSYNCPVEIDIRRHVWLNKPVHDSHCLTCGACIARCPRSVLRFERLMQPIDLAYKLEKK